MGWSSSPGKWVWWLELCARHIPRVRRVGPMGTTDPRLHVWELLSTLGILAVAGLSLQWICWLWGIGKGSSLKLHLPLL